MVDWDLLIDSRLTYGRCLWSDVTGSPHCPELLGLDAAFMACLDFPPPSLRFVVGILDLYKLDVNL